MNELMKGKYHYLYNFSVNTTHNYKNERCFLLQIFVFPFMFCFGRKMQRYYDANQVSEVGKCFFREMENSTIRHNINKVWKQKCLSVKFIFVVMSVEMYPLWPYYQHFGCTRYNFIITKENQICFKLFIPIHVLIFNNKSKEVEQKTFPLLVSLQFHHIGEKLSPFYAKEE